MVAVSPGSFNPRPARRPGATRDLALDARTSHASLRRFQSSPGPQAGRYQRAMAAHLGCNRAGFNPRPARRPGATWNSPIRISAVRQAFGAFQSSPGPQAGRYSDAEVRDGFKAGVVSVSILARPAGRALQVIAAIDLVQPPLEVSILARPAGRALPSPFGTRARRLLFVSILARPAGRALPASGIVPHGLQLRDRCFNPRPARRPGATLPNPRYGARALDYCRLSGGCHAQRRVPRPRDPQIRPLYGRNGARTADLRAIAEDSRSCVIQNTNVPRWSNGGRAPNVRRCRASGSRRR